MAQWVKWVKILHKSESLSLVGKAHIKVKGKTVPESHPLTSTRAYYSTQAPHLHTLIYTNNNKKIK